MRLLITFVALSMTTWAADFLGTWKWNLEKTTLTPLPKAATTTREANGPDGVKSSTTITSQSGAVNTWGYTAKYDGKEYSVTGNQNFDTIALKREDANTTRIEVHKKGGKYHAVWSSRGFPRREDCHIEHQGHRQGRQALDPNHRLRKAVNALKEKTRASSTHNSRRSFGYNLGCQTTHSELGN